MAIDSRIAVVRLGEQECVVYTDRRTNSKHVFPVGGYMPISVKLILQRIQPKKHER